MTPLVLVHGFLGGGAQWAGQREALGDGLITLDLPGFGARSHEAPLPSIEAYADWVIAQTQASGIDRYTLMGHSMGGMIAQEVARRDGPRIDRLILYATGSIGVLPGRFETIETSKARAVADGAEATARRIAATWFLRGEEAPGFGATAAIAAKAQLPAITAGLDAMQGWSGEARLAEITMPTLVLWGDGDRTYPWSQIQTLWQAIPDAHLAVIPGCAHAVHAEKLGLFHAHLRDFLSL